MKYISILTTLFILGCGSTPPVSMSPDKAKVPELEFYYFKGGDWIRVHGHGGSKFQPGESRKFRIKLHKKMGDCQINYVDGDEHFTRDCKGHSSYELDLGQYYNSTPSITSFSVASEAVGIQVGHFYAAIGLQGMALPISIKCPEQSTHNNVSTCSRPATYKMKVMAINPDNEAGKIHFEYKCLNKDKVVKIDEDILGEEYKEYTINSDIPTYCVAGLALKINTTKLYSHLVHIRFYDPKYIPLPAPTIKKDSKGYLACAKGNYKLYSVNGNDKGSGIFSGKCERVEEKPVDIIVWDEIGRVGHSFLPGEEIENFNQPQLAEGWGFYTNMYPWFKSQIKKKCRYFSKDCIKEIMYHPKMVQAVENWDSNKLYE